MRAHLATTATLLILCAPAARAVQTVQATPAVPAVSITPAGSITPTIGVTGTAVVTGTSAAASAPAAAPARQGAAVPDTSAPRPLTEEQRLRLEELLAAPAAPRADAQELLRSVLARDGEASVLFEALEAAAQAPDPGGTGGTRAARAQRLASFLLHAEGRLAEALKACDAALAAPGGATAELLLQRAHLLDAQARGDDARAAYALAREASSDEDQREHIDLRMALLATTRKGPAAPASPGGTRTALFELARSPERAAEFKNRAAVVLAILGQPQEARELYVPEGEGSALFRQEVRLAEWALAAKQPAQAQEHAWKARAAATLRRDRLYALTVLVESYRAGDGLARLIERFAATPELDAESRRTWIDLLRETARVDEAMALFQSSAEGGFTPEMRRELLEMCREAGREEELIETYGRLIAAEPDVVEWREGLARHWLERGRRADATAVWQAFVDTHPALAERLQAARLSSAMGLTEFARGIAEGCLAEPNGLMEARLFLFELELRLGRVEAARQELDHFDRQADPAAPQRVQLSEAYERAGDKAKATQVLESLRSARGADESEEDLEMRLAWLLSETGDEKLALERWQNLWRRVSSVSRRRQVEDRLMAVAARLGVLADIAVALEQKLRDGTAEDRDAGLLVRLYNKVGDPVSAAEVIEEHLRRKGGGDVAVLEEQARVYLGGKDYYNFEKAVRRLLVLDPESEADRLRQLAMSNLERGRPAEARSVLQRLAQCENPGDAAEFEAGVLAIAGLHADAARTYRRGLAQHPERIDGYLLLGNTLRSLRKTEEAVGLFQHLAETADKDDLFTVAIDGLLNMRPKEPVLEWARRVTLERMARRADKMYLYQLYSDLCDEVGDTPGLLRALETALAIAAEQRGAILRQLMDASQGKAQNVYTVVNGVLVQRRQGGADARRLAYGRRLIGLGDLVPPQVYLELGESFLGAGEVSNAAKTFSGARDVPDWGAFQRQVASSFQNAAYAEHALEVYERLMASQALEIDLLVRTAQLYEQLGRDERAAELYALGLETLLARHALTATAQQKPDEQDDDFGWAARNIGDFEKYVGPLTNGLLAAGDEALLARFSTAQRALLAADLTALDALPVPAEGAVRTLEALPRVRHRAALLRRLALRTGDAGAARELDLTVVARCAQDEAALDGLAREYLARGYDTAAVRLVEESALAPEARTRVLQRLGRGARSDDGAQLAPRDLIGRILPLIVDGRTQELGLLLRRARTGATDKDDLPFVQALVTAAVFARDEPAVQALTHYALRTIVAHGKGWEERERVIALLQRARGVLSPAAFDVLLASFVGLVTEDDKKLQEFQYVLVQLQSGRDQPLLSADDVRERLDKCLPDNHYMIPTLLGLVPAEARLALLQPLWTRVPAASRAYLALDTLTSSEELAPPELIEFVREAFDAALEAVDEADELSYPLRQLADNERFPIATLEALCAAAAKRFPDTPAYALQVARCRAKQGDRAAAIAAFEAVLPALSRAEERNWTTGEALEALLTTLGKESATELLALLERFETQQGVQDGHEQLDQLRAQLFELADDPAARRAWLKQKLERKGDDVGTLNLLLADARQAADVARQHELLVKLLEAQPQKPEARQQLVQFWLGRRDPARALEVKRAGDDAVKKPAPDEARKLAPATHQAVKKAVDEKDPALARATYRRTWRNFQVEDRSYGMVYARYYGSSANEPLWPADAPAVDDNALDEARKGGLAQKKLLELDAHGDVRHMPVKKPGTRTVWEALAGFEWGRPELARQVRSLDDGALSGARGLLRGLQLAEIERLGADAALASWKGSVRAGQAGTLERSLLLAWYEEHLDSVDDQARQLLADLTLGVNPLDARQLRGLARLFHKVGERARALNLYRWCGSLASAQRWFSGGEPTVSAHELIDEVLEQLGPEDRVPVLEAILAAAKGASDEEQDGEYEALAIRTWRKALPPAAALERCRPLCERALDLRQGLRREAAGEAARLYLAAGDLDAALRGIEIAHCRLDEKDVQLTERQGYSRRWLLQERSLGWWGYQQFLPPTVEAPGGAAAWYGRLLDAVRGWTKDKRLNESELDEALLVAALRLDAAHAPEAALPWVEELARRPDADAWDQLVVIDLFRRLGREERAVELESTLVGGHRLATARLPDHVERLRQAQGDAAAFAAGESAAQWTGERKLLVLLADLAGRLGNTERQAHWQGRVSANETAAKELEAKW